MELLDDPRGDSGCLRVSIWKKRFKRYARVDILEQEASEARIGIE
jgi:hypothetical protein